ncbi:MAG: DUF4167 domain-containing protein [Rickettsiales bacterium]|nr:DUF4167 domain-containing protein [Rickettsiales bacterium]
MRKKTNHSNNGRSNRSRGKGGRGGDSQSLARQKKNALQQKEKYLNMARDAQTNGDRVDAEYYFQHVEHYSRLVAEIIEKEPAPKEAKEKSSDAKEDAPKDGNKLADNDNNDADNAAEESSDKEIPLPAGAIPEAELAATGN